MGLIEMRFNYGWSLFLAKISFGLLIVVISSNSHSVSREHYEAAERFVKLLRVEDTLAENIKNQQSERVDEIREIFPDLENDKFVDFYMSEIQPYLEQMYSWQEIGPEITSIYAESFSLEEINSFVQFLESKDMENYIASEVKFSAALNKWIDTKRNEVMSGLEEFHGNILSKYKKKLQDDKPKSIKEINIDDYYTISIFDCEWPIPKDMNLKGNEFDRHVFYQADPGIFDIPKRIVLSNYEEQLQTKLDGEFKVLVTDLDKEYGFDIYKVEAWRGDRKNTDIFTRYLYARNGYQLSTFNFDEVERAFMFEYCNATYRNTKSLKELSIENKSVIKKLKSHRAEKEEN